jgi:hypothetical protein
VSDGLYDIIYDVYAQRDGNCISFVFISQQTATFAPHSINWLLFITEINSVYCAVRTGNLNKVVCASSLKG